MNKSVDILLSTYNGEKFLQEQIESIFKQNFKNWHLLIRDDGSNDSTVSILSKYKDIYPSKITIIKDLEGNLGPAFSFFKLLKVSNASYVAFCDQDDIWGEDKLTVGIKKLLECPENLPAAYSSRVECIDDCGNELGASNLPKNICFENAVVENILYGCTLILNKSAINILRAARPSRVLMHDWWIYLVISAFGVVLFDKNPSIRYRLHSGNTIGYHGNNFRKNITKVIPFLRSLNSLDSFRVTGQLKEFLTCYEHELSSDKLKSVHEIILARNSLTKRVKLIVKGKYCRNSFWDSLAFYAQVIIGKY